MADERRPESADLTDYQTLDSYDTLNGDPGDDPLDRGVVAPERWSAGMRSGTTAAELERGESLDQLLAEEEPEATLSFDQDPASDEPWPDEGSDPRSGRLIAPDGGHHVHRQSQLLAHDVGPDGGGATAEEAAVHVVDDIDIDQVLSLAPSRPGPHRWGAGAHKRARLGGAAAFQDVDHG
jgi:Family of unknown function (DUF5709)